MHLIARQTLKVQLSVAYKIFSSKWVRDSYLKHDRSVSLLKKDISMLTLFSTTDYFNATSSLT